MQNINEPPENRQPENENAYIGYPPKLPFCIRAVLWIAKKKIKKDLLLPKLLAWYPKTAVSSGIMEAMAASGGKDISARLLKLIRIQVSVYVSCPFCVDMNALECEKAGVTRREAEDIINGGTNASGSLSEKEKTALEYVRRISDTPVDITDDIIKRMKIHFTEKETVIIAGTASQVNYWARLTRALGVPAAGFTEYCRLKPRRK